MKICIIGTGYVGLVSGACIADAGNTVWCVDKDASKIASLKSGRVPIYEPGLEDTIKRNEDEGRLFYTTLLDEGLKDANICFITVDTPPDGDGHADLTNVLAVAASIGQTLAHKTVVATKSTVPVGTTMLVKDAITRGLASRGLDPAKFLSVASNPEFLKEGSAVEDFMKPDRVIVGTEDEETGRLLHELYAPFMRRQDRFIKMSIASAEIAKYAANSMLATRISFVNEMARLCDAVGADISDVRRALASDPRIGPDFLYPSLGFGGSCLPKDLRAITGLGRNRSSPLDVVEAAHRTNERQREWFWEKVAAHFGDKLRDKHIGIWGLAFKANTDDVRFSPAIFLLEKLIGAGAKASAFDPAAVGTSKRALGEKAQKVFFADSAYAAVEGADALIICTEWREFRSPDFGRMKSIMKTPLIFDGRNLYEPGAAREQGFDYVCIGRPRM